MFCPYCGSQTVEGAAFCVKCGKQLPNSATLANNPNTQNIPTQPVNNIAGDTAKIVQQTVLPSPQGNTAKTVQQTVLPNPQANTAKIVQQAVLPNPQANNLFVAPPPQQVSRVGYSNAVNDPRFISKRKNQSCLALGCSIIMIPIPFIGFWAYSQFWHGMEMSEALKVGAGVSAIFFVFYLILWIKKLFSHQWEGVVIGLSEEEHLSRKNYHSEGSTFTRHDNYYYLYVVKIQTDSGKIKRIENKSAKSFYFNYFKVGDRVKYHPDIDYYEKYDKTNDTHLLCPLCNRVNPITDDVCQCGVPIIK